MRDGQCETGSYRCVGRVASRLEDVRANLGGDFLLRGDHSMKGDHRLKA